MWVTVYHIHYILKIYRGKNIFPEKYKEDQLMFHIYYIPNYIMNTLKE